MSSEPDVLKLIISGPNIDKVTLSDIEKSSIFYDRISNLTHRTGIEDVYTFDFTGKLKDVTKTSLEINNETYEIKIYYDPENSFFLKPKKEKCNTPNPFFKDLKRICKCKALTLDDYKTYQSFRVLSSKREMKKPEGIFDIFRRNELPDSISSVVPIKEGFEKFKKNYIIIVSNTSRATVKNSLIKQVPLKYSNGFSRLSFQEKSDFIEYWQKDFGFKKKIGLPFFILSSKELLKKYVFDAFSGLGIKYEDFIEDKDFFTATDAQEFCGLSGSAKEEKITEDRVSGIKITIDSVKGEKITEDSVKKEKITIDSVKGEKTTEDSVKKEKTPKDTNDEVRDAILSLLDEHKIVGDLRDIFIELSILSIEKLKEVGINDKEKMFKIIIEEAGLDYQFTIDFLDEDLTDIEKCQGLLEELPG
jgi:hypothetical protein